MLHILTYHRIAEPSDTPALNPRLISALPVVFDRQMRYLAQHYDVISLQSFFHAVFTGVKLPKRAVLLTFDDAYIDFGTIAWPILKRYQLPVTLFVPTAFPSQPHQTFWWDNLYHSVMQTKHTVLSHPPLGDLPLTSTEQRADSLRRLQDYLKSQPHGAVIDRVSNISAILEVSPVKQQSVLGWDELRGLACEGVTLAAHSRTHAILTRLTSEEIMQEITGSQDDLQREIGHTLPIFCYPSGIHDDRVVTLLKEAGFAMAFATENGLPLTSSASHALLRLGRTNLTRRTSLPIFRLRLTHLGTLLDRWRCQKKPDVTLARQT